MIFVVKQLTSTIPYNNYYILQVFLIAIVHVILFSKMAEFTHDAEPTLFYGITKEVIDLYAYIYSQNYCKNIVYSYNETINQ